MKGPRNSTLVVVRLMMSSVPSAVLQTAAGFGRAHDQAVVPVRFDELLAQGFGAIRSLAFRVAVLAFACDALEFAECGDERMILLSVFERG